MESEPRIDTFELQCLEALKALGRVMLQLSLYEAAHPSVEEKLKEGSEFLTAALAASPRGSLVFAKVQDRWLANGKVIASAGEAGGPVAALIQRFKLSSITFLPGLTVPELIALCELAASKPDETLDLKAFFTGRGIDHIRFNETVYAKVDGSFRPGEPGAVAGEGGGAGPGSGTGPGGGTGALGSGGPGVSETGFAVAQIQGQTIEASLQILIRKVAKDKEEQARLYALIMEQLRHEIERKVIEATKVLRRDKIVLEFEQERAHSVMENMGEGLIVVDGKGEIVLMNPAAEEIYGAKLSEVAGKPLVAKMDDQRVVALASEIEGPTDPSMSAAVRVDGTDGTKRTIRASWAVVQNEAKRVVGMVMMLTDVAKHKQLEKDERDFVARITHELRSPLTSIQASLEILQDQLKGKLTAELNKIFTLSLMNAERLATLINDIMDFSKIGAGQMRIYPEPTDPRKAAAEAFESMRPWAEKRKLRFSLTAAPELPAVLADHPRVVQVLVNLLSNAIKFTRSGGAVEVKAGRSPTEPDRWVEFAVADTGFGIPKEEQERIFQKFVQISSGGTNIGGTGLGLSIAKAFVELHGGQMWFESEVDKGTTFSFTLPIVAAAVQPATQAPAAAPRPWWKRLLGIR